MTPLRILERFRRILERFQSILERFRALSEKSKKNRVKNEDFNDDNFLYVLIYPETQFYAIKPRFHDG